MGTPRESVRFARAVEDLGDRLITRWHLGPRNGVTAEVLGDLLGATEAALCAGLHAENGRLRTQSERVRWALGELLSAAEGVFLLDNLEARQRWDAAAAVARALAPSRGGDRLVSGAVGPGGDAVTTQELGLSISDHVEVTHERELAPGTTSAEVRRMHEAMHRDGDHWGHDHRSGDQGGRDTGGRDTGGRG